MKKLVIGLLSTIVISLYATSNLFAYALTFQNWGFDPNISPYTIISPIDEMTMLSLSLNNSMPTSPGYGTFKTLGALQAEHFQNDNVIVNGSGINVDYQITGIMKTSGHYDLNISTGLNDLTFTSGTFDLYIDPNFDYGTDTDGPPNFMFGSNNGTKIASFELLTGSGTMNYAIPNPDGRTDLEWVSTYLATGYWYDNQGQDMSEVNQIPLILAMTDSNNTVIRNPSDIAKNEFLEDGTMEYTQVGDDANLQNFLSSNGSFAPAPTPIPEPAALFLLGLGVLGLVKVIKKNN